MQMQSVPVVRSPWRERNVSIWGIVKRKRLAYAAGIEGGVPSRISMILGETKDQSQTPAWAQMASRASTGVIAARVSVIFFFPISELSVIDSPDRGPSSWITSEMDLSWQRRSR